MVFMKRRGATAPRRRRVRRAAKKTPARARPTTAITRAVTSVLNRKAETKMAIYYSSNSGFAGDGLYANRSWSPQNQWISVTSSDLKRMIPFVQPGNAENQRIGDQVTPLSLVTHGTVKLTLGNLAAQLPDDIFVVMYVLEHVTFKSYSSLIAGNNFTQLLKTGENTTARFDGDVWSSQIPVADQYYRLLKKKIIRLRYAGITPSGPTPTEVQLSVANSHDYRASFSLTLGQKNLPAKYKYPENATVAGSADPLNSAPFFAMGFFWASGAVSPTATVLMEQQYVSMLKYKDI